MVESSNLHVALFPWAAFGHIIPYLELAKLIARKGHKVTFVSTTKNIARLPKIPPELASHITLLGVPLPRVDDDPLLKRAYDGLEPAYVQFLENSIPDWIIYDFAPYWLAPTATRLGIRKATFRIVNAWFIASVGSTHAMINGTDSRRTVKDFTVPPSWVPFDTKVVFKPYEINWLFRKMKEKGASGISEIKRSGLSIQGADVIVVRQSPEFEGAWINLLEDLHQKPVIPVGMMPPPVDNSTESWTSSSVKKWLDTQPNSSVLYVALGTEVSLSQSELIELAHGLELAGVPFFWALRKPAGLPDGYEERVKGRGVVWKGWAPQVNILSHDSVGGFLTHCGWSSCIEGAVFGRPLVMLPFLVDQGLNARVMEGRNVGVEIPRNDDDRSFSGESVAKCVRMVMVGDDREMYRQKARDLSEVFGDGKLQDGYVEAFMVENRPPKG